MTTKQKTKIVAIIQARTSSKRFYNKVFLDIKGKPVIWHLIERLKKSNLVNHILLATTKKSSDFKLVEWAKKNNTDFFTGNENNVLKRYYKAAKKVKADIIVRITADDPLKDPFLIDEVISLLINEKLDFACNNNPPSFPEGLDVEVFTFNSLKKAYKNVKSDFDKEHVTQFFHDNQNIFKQKNLMSMDDLSSHRWTIDYQEDYEMIKVIYDKLYLPNQIFYTKEIIELIKKNPEIKNINLISLRSHRYRNNE